MLNNIGNDVYLCLSLILLGMFQIFPDQTLASENKFHFIPFKIYFPLQYTTSLEY